MDHILLEQLQKPKPVQQLYSSRQYLKGQDGQRRAHLGIFTISPLSTGKNSFQETVLNHTHGFQFRPLRL